MWAGCGEVRGGVGYVAVEHVERSLDPGRALGKLRRVPRDGWAPQSPMRMSFIGGDESGGCMPRAYPPTGSSASQPYSTNTILLYCYTTILLYYGLERSPTIPCLAQPYPAQPIARHLRQQRVKGAQLDSTLLYYTRIYFSNLQPAAVVLPLRQLPSHSILHSTPLYFTPLHSTPPYSTGLSCSTPRSSFFWSSSPTLPLTAFGIWSTY